MNGEWLIGSLIVSIDKTPKMDKKKGLVDNQDGEFILNESGSSVSTDKVTEDGEGRADTPAPRDAAEDSELAGTAAQPKDNTD